MKYSIFTVMSPASSPAEIVSKLKRFGYDGVEWRVQNAAPINAPDPMPPRERLYWDYNLCTLDVSDIAHQTASAKALCDASGIECYSLASYLPTGEFDKIEALMKAAKSVGAKMVRLFPARYDPSLSYLPLFDRNRKELCTVEELAKAYNVPAVLEQHMDTIIPSASAAYRLVEGRSSDYIGVVFDAGNMVYEGYEQYRMGMELLGGYVHHVHIKDSRKSDGKVQWSPIGDGDVRFDLLRDAMKAIGYDRYLSFEDFSTELSDDEKLTSNLAYIKGIMNA